VFVYNLMYNFLLVLQIIIPDDNKQMIYVSTDEGVSYNARTIPVDQKSLRIHPTKNGWMLGVDSSNVCTSYWS